MRTSSFLRLLMKRLLLSAAVKKMLVRLVSTRTTSSDSCGGSSFGLTGGLGDAAGCGSVTRLDRDFWGAVLSCANDLRGAAETASSKTARPSDNTKFPNARLDILNLLLRSNAVGDRRVTMLRSHL